MAKIANLFRSGGQSCRKEAPGMNFEWIKPVSQEVAASEWRLRLIVAADTRRIGPTINRFAAPLFYCVRKL